MTEIASPRRHPGQDGHPRCSDETAHRAFADAVRYYPQLRPRQLPSRFIYDTLGSALFDAICHLPWYRITRAELGLLRRHAAAIGAVLRNGGRAVELGSGNGEKLSVLLKHADIRRVHAHLIDLSAAALAHAAQTLAMVDGVEVHLTTQQATYEDGLLRVALEDRRPTLMAFLGSNLGNFDAPGAMALLRSIRASLQSGDCLLLGADLVKPERELLLAYDDPLGLIAAFDKNLLVRINSELGGDFQIDQFVHRAIWNRHASRVEMHLVSACRQEVRVDEAELHFTLEPGQTIWTESSYKYEPHGLRELVQPAGFVQRDQWLDEDCNYALTLFEAG